MEIWEFLQQEGMVGGEEEFEEAFVSGPQLTVLPNRRMEEKEKPVCRVMAVEMGSLSDQLQFD